MILTGEMTVSLLAACIGAILGAILGAIGIYIIERNLQDRERNLEKAKIAKAFLLELKGHEKFLLSSLNDKYLENTKPSTVNLYNHALESLHWDHSFYDNYDLFSTNRMSIFCLDEELCEKMNFFYDNLIVSDEYRLVFNDYIENTFMTSQLQVFENTRRQ